MIQRNSHAEAGLHSASTLLIAGVISATTLFVSFALLAIDFEYFWVTYIIGFGGILPTAVGLHVSRTTHEPNAASHEADTADEDAAIAALRERYARGELTDAEFESRIERLLETESTEDTRRTVGADSG